MSSPTAVLDKLSSVNDVAEGGYSVFVYYLNKDLVKTDGANDLFGIVIPCGSYPNEKQAAQAQTVIAASTGAQCVVACAHNHGFALNSTATKSSIVFPYTADDNMEHIKQSIERERKKKEEIRERLDKEVEEREDRESLSYFINKVYHAYGIEERIKQQQAATARLEQAWRENYDLMLAYASKHPEALETWKEEARKRLTERGEGELFSLMMAKMSELEPKIREQTTNAAVHVPQRRPFKPGCPYITTLVGNSTPVVSDGTPAPSAVMPVVTPVSTGVVTPDVSPVMVPPPVEQGTPLANPFVRSPKKDKRHKQPTTQYSILQKDPGPVRVSHDGA